MGNKEEIRGPKTKVPSNFEMGFIGLCQRYSLFVQLCRIIHPTLGEFRIANIPPMRYHSGASKRYARVPIRKGQFALRIRAEEVFKPHKKRLGEISSFLGVRTRLPSDYVAGQIEHHQRQRVPVVISSMGGLDSFAGFCPENQIDSGTISYLCSFLRHVKIYWRGSTFFWLR